MATPLDSYLSGTWQRGKERPTPLLNPSTEEVLAEASTAGVDLAAAVAWSRDVGGNALRGLTFAQRAELLRALAKNLADGREELISLGIANAGNTRSDAKFDIDGAAATLMYYAELGASLGAVSLLVDGEGTTLGRSARLYGQHVLVPRAGVAVHINAFNFPAWGLAEKLGPALLSGVPVISKPATATALLAHRMVQRWVEQKLLPEGALSLVCGGAGDLLSHLRGQDVLAFTGSGETAAQLRRGEAITRENVRVNVEADSLNAAVLGADVSPGSETFHLFIGDVVKEVSQKAGQKCTAFRRLYVPPDRLDEVREALRERLAEVRVGNPADEKVTMGPLATRAQQGAVREGLARLAKAGAVEALSGARPSGEKGFFLGPTLLVHASPHPGDAVHEVEVFGPVVTLMPYAAPAEAVKLVSAGGGGLVGSIYSDDKTFLTDMVLGLAPFHGRLTLSGEKVAGQTVPPGTVLPQLNHGGPGRAGGGEELGGLRGLSLYLQRAALQGHRGLIEQLVLKK